MDQHRFGQAIKAGLIAWVVFTLVLYMAPLMGVPKMDVPAMLGGMFGLNSLALGWVMHLMIGVVLALIYAYWFADVAGGAPWVRGLTFGMLPWLAMMVVIAPMLPVVNPMLAKMPPGVFLANMGIMASVGSLIGHLIWGAVLGAVYGGVEVRRRAVAMS
jgi:uncharacterized membrane protein YagU involved in acid resistance